MNGINKIIYISVKRKLLLGKSLLHQAIDCNDLLRISAMITSLFGNSGKNQENEGRTFQIYRAAQNSRYSSVPISYPYYVVASLDFLVGKNLISWWISLSGREWREIAFSRDLDSPIFPFCLSPKWGESFNLNFIPKKMNLLTRYKKNCKMSYF